MQRYDFDVKDKQGYEGNDRRGENGGEKKEQKVQLLEWNNSDDEYFSEGEFSALDFDNAVNHNVVSLFIVNQKMFFVIIFISFLF